jgi:hypothetical protein
MRNREITKNEINKITEKCLPREQAFFTVMRQSGLTPSDIKKLKIRDLEKILETETPIPCKIEVSLKTRKGELRKTPAFVGFEATKYLRQYFKKDRKNLTPESLLFTIHGNPNKEINTKDVSRAFRLAARELGKENAITFGNKHGKPNELKLFNLVKFYRKNAKNYLEEINSLDKAKDHEFYRKLYEEKAMLLLETEADTGILIEIKKREERLKKMEMVVELLSQTQYQSTINLLSKPPEEAQKELKLTPEAFQRIRIDDEKTSKKPSERLIEISEMFKEAQEGNPQRLMDFRKKLNPKLFNSKGELI